MQDSVCLRADESNFNYEIGILRSLPPRYSLA